MQYDIEKVRKTLQVVSMEGTARIGVIDADLIGRPNHRFPNLACEKIAGYWKQNGAEVALLTNYDRINQFDRVYVSKVFTDTEVPQWLTDRKNVHIGGTGFFFDKAPNLPNEIEHHAPDYHLYDDWIAEQVASAEESAAKKNKPFNRAAFIARFKQYTDYSIGFLTRGCFRKCRFCVNQKYDRVFQHSPLQEFYDPARKKICLLDDNFFGCSHWKELLKLLIDTKRPFKFKQGLDERTLTDEKCEMLFSCNYDGDYTFAFDSVSDYDLINQKLKLIRKHAPAKANIKFYVLVGFEGTDAQDIANAFKRIELLMQYQCLPYVMRYQSKTRSPWEESQYRGLYIALARWANQPSLFKKKSFRQFCELDQTLHKTNGLCSAMRSLAAFEREHKDIAEKYFDLRYQDFVR